MKKIKCSIFLLIMILTSCNELKYNRNNFLFDYGNGIMQPEIDYIIERIHTMIPIINEDSQIIPCDTCNFDFLLLQISHDILPDYSKPPENKQLLILINKILLTYEESKYLRMSGIPQSDCFNYNIEIYSFSNYNNAAFICSFSSKSFVENINHLIKDYEPTGDLPLFIDGSLEPYFWIQMNNERYYYTFEYLNEEGINKKRFHLLATYILSEIYLREWY